MMKSEVQLLLGLLGGGTMARSQVTLSLTPAVVSNSYPGVITLEPQL